MDCGLEVINGFRQPALELPSNAHAQQAVIEIGVDLQCFFEMRRGLIGLAAAPQRQGQIVFYVEIRWSNRERVLKQSEAVAPALNLRVCESGKD